MPITPIIGNFLSIKFEAAYNLPELADILTALTDLDLGIAHSLNDIGRLARYIGYTFRGFAHGAAY